MPKATKSKKAPQKPTASGAKGTSTKGPEKLEAITLKVEPDMPRPVAASQWSNHINIQVRGTHGGGDEVTITLWQIPAYTIDATTQTAKAAYLGSYVMTRSIAEGLRDLLAENLRKAEPDGLDAG